MRGQFQDQGGFFSYIRPEERIPADHPLREIRKLVREVLQELSHSFGELYSQEGRPSIPPEQLLSALLLQVFYGLRSERQLMEQLNYNAMCSGSSWKGFWITQRSSRCCRTSISLSTARSSRPGPRTRASSPRTARITATARTFTAKGARTTRIKAQASRRPSSIAKRPGARPSSAIWVMRLTAPSRRP